MCAIKKQASEKIINAQNNFLLFKINECAPDPCFLGVPCTDLIASFSCGPCPGGYSGDGVNCTRMDGSKYCRADGSGGGSPHMRILFLFILYFFLAQAITTNLYYWQQFVVTLIFHISYLIGYTANVVSKQGG